MRRDSSITISGADAVSADAAPPTDAAAGDAGLADAITAHQTTAAARMRGRLCGRFEHIRGRRQHAELETEHLQQTLELIVRLPAHRLDLGARAEAHREKGKAQTDLHVQLVHDVFTQFA